MTKFQKQMLTIAAAGALTAVTALPALAFENEFHGAYNFTSVFSNFQDGGSGNFTPNTAVSKRKMNNYFEQRARLQYIAKASDDLKLVTHFEIDSRFGGVTDGKYAGSSDSGTLDSDGINLETKHVYLDFNVGKNFNVKTGIMPYKDTLKGIFIDADVPAVVATTKMGAYTLGLGFSRFSESQQTGTATARLGDRAKDLFIMDNIYAVNKDTKAALSYYFLADYQTAGAETLAHTLGLSGETKVGALGLSGFAAMQAGHTKSLTGNNTHRHGWAANVAANVKVGPGTAKTGFLFVSGNNNQGDFQNRGWVNSGVQSYNESGSMILIRNTANSPTSTDRYLRRVIDNIAVANLGYNAKLTDKFSVDGNVLFGWVPSSAGAPVDKDPKFNKANASDFLGTEINLEAGYQLYKNLSLRAQAGYFILGGYYKGAASDSVAASVKDPENPYTMRLQARYSF